MTISVPKKNNVALLFREPSKTESEVLFFPNAESIRFSRQGLAIEPEANSLVLLTLPSAIYNGLGFLNLETLFTGRNRQVSLGVFKRNKESKLYALERYDSFHSFLASQEQAIETLIQDFESRAITFGEDTEKVRDYLLNKLYGKK